MRIRYAAGIIAVFTFAAVAVAVRPAKMKVDTTEDRMTISCLDHGTPNLKLLNPVSGPVITIDCEREK